jgi:hypothetical protein
MNTDFKAMLAYEGRSRRQQLEPRQEKIRKNYCDLNQVWWCTPAIPVTQEAEVGGSQSNTIPGTKV